MAESNSNNQQIIREGSAIVETKGNVFYNPVQEFNRDLSVAVLIVYSQECRKKKIGKSSHKNNETVEETPITIILNNSDNANNSPSGAVSENGIYILEALSATGLRSIRYAKEIPGIKKIVANDISKKAVENIETNVKLNEVNELVETSHSDATMLMYSCRQEKEFDVIDLDPYGCPSIFLDSAVQAVKDGGLLLVTATDMAVLAGNCPETCYTKYGAISLRMKACHEMAIRILLQCIESHANRYGRYIEPLLSISADFYIRVFVKIFVGPAKCKYTTSKLSMVYHCTGCDSFTLQPLGIVRKSEHNKNVKFALPTSPSISANCEHCNQKHHMGGPIWSGPLHSKYFVCSVLENAPKQLGTWKRIQGILNVIGEELNENPLYYTLDRLSSTIHCETPPMLTVRSAILNAGYEVSFSHANKTSIKTNAPSTFIWDILRYWEKSHPVKKERLVESSPGFCILNKKITNEVNLEPHPDANPQSRKRGFVRYQENPSSHWGPGTRATAMIGDKKLSKSKKNQGKNQVKRKRNNSDNSSKEPNKRIETVL